MLDDNTTPETPTVSPTGQPILPPAAARAVTIAIVAALAGLGSAAVYWPDCRGLQVALAVVTALAAVLGIASPGLRKTVALLLVVGIGLTVSGCGHWQPTPAQDAKLIDCAAQGVLTAAVELVPDVIAAIGGQPVDWAKELESLLKAEGPKALCAGQVVADVLRGTSTAAAQQALAASGGGVGGSEVSPVLQARLEAWLQLHAGEFAR